MTNTNLLEVIKALGPNKRQEMAVFLASPFFNRGKNAQEITRLFQIILKEAPNFSETELTKERVSALVFEKSNLEPGKLEKLVADLNKLLRRFALAQQYFSEENEEQQQIDWAKWLRVHGLSDASRKTLLKLNSKREQDHLESLDRCRTDFLIAEENHLWEGTHNLIRGDSGIPNLILRLDLYYYNCRIELENRYMLQQKGAQLPDLEAFENGFDFYQNRSVLLQIAMKINRLLHEKFSKVEEFKELMRQLREKESYLSYQTRAQFYAYLRNFCTLQINEGNLEFIGILHEIHKDNLSRRYFFINGELSPNVYINISMVANRAKEFEWGKKFTEEYKGLLIGGDENHFFYRFNMAHCYFAEGNFEQALDQMPEAPSSSHYHHIVRLLELKIYYELRSELLLYKIDAFRKFTVRTATKTIAANLREMDLNFLNILTQLSQSPLKDKARSEKLLKRIASKKLLADRAWLIEKAKELG